MNQSTMGIPKARELPEGFVYIDELIEDCIIDAKYAGTDNFMGCPIDGYEQPLVVMCQEAAADNDDIIHSDYLSICSRGKSRAFARLFGFVGYRLARYFLISGTL